MQPDGIELVYEDGKGGGRIIIIFMRYYGPTDQQPVQFWVVINTHLSSFLLYAFTVTYSLPDMGM